MDEVYYLLHAPHILVAHAPALIAEHIFLEAHSVGTEVELPVAVSNHAVIPSNSCRIRCRIPLSIGGTVFLVAQGVELMIGLCLEPSYGPFSCR